VEADLAKDELSEGLELLKEEMPELFEEKPVENITQEKIEADSDTIGEEMVSILKSVVKSIKTGEIADKKPEKVENELEVERETIAEELKKAEEEKQKAVEEARKKEEKKLRKNRRKQRNS